MAIMDIMAITAVMPMPIRTIIGRMATMTLIISVNIIASTIIRVAILGDVINHFWYGYGHNCSSGHNRCNGHIGCYEHIFVMTKHSLVVLIAILAFMTLIAGNAGIALITKMAVMALMAITV